MTSVELWNDADTARYYDAFTRRHDRYRLANDALIANADIREGAHVLDLAAGTGLTTLAALGQVGSTGSVMSFEPAAAMRRLGMERVSDPRVTWTSVWPEGATFNRVLCGAAVWQLPLEETVESVAHQLEPGGAFVFNVPSLYLGIPDLPGGGSDPWLLELPTLIPHERMPQSPTEPLTIERIETVLAARGFERRERWSFRLRLTQQAYRDWLKIPVINGAWIESLYPAERAALIDRLYLQVDPGSWRWEQWHGWTAWN